MMNAKYWSGIVALLLFVVLPPHGEGAGEFVPLFNGRDLTGWKIPAGDNGHWRVAGGVIDYDAESEAAGDKSLWTERSFGDFTLKADWRLKETPYVNPSVPIIRFDGTNKKDATGKEIRISVPDADSGLYLRGTSKAQVNIWCWPIGSGEVYGYRMDRSMPASVRAGVTPHTQADKPVGQWNSFRIVMKRDKVTVYLNGELVVDNATLANYWDRGKPLPKKGPIELQHHGDELWFKNIYVKELPGT
jgi:hypothetical protein